MYLALTLNVFALGDDGEDGLRAALVAEVVVPALPRPVAEEGEAARQEERVGPRLAPPRQPLALGGHRQVRAGPRPQQRRPARRGRPEDALARLAVVDLQERKKEVAAGWFIRVCTRFVAFKWVRIHFRCLGVAAAILCPSYSKLSFFERLQMATLAGSDFSSFHVNRR